MLVEDCFNKNTYTNVYKTGSFLFVLLIVVVFIVPLIIFGEGNFITVHDNLDNMLPQFVKAKDFGFFSLDTPTGVMDNTSSAYFGWGGFTIQNVLYYLLPPYMAYVTMYILAIALGLSSMYYLQRVVFGEEHKHIYLITSCLYAILPVIPSWSIACAALPFAAIIFIKLIDGISWKWLAASFFLPFFLELNCNAIFVCMLWGVGFMYLSVKQKKVHLPSLAGLFLLSFGTILFNLRLFYMQFVLHEDLNRAHFGIDHTNFTEAFKHFFVEGHYHAASIQSDILLPLSLCFVILTISLKNGLCYRLAKNEGIDAQVFKKESFVGIVCFCTILFFSLFAALDYSHLLDGLKDIVAPLKGFSFFRFFTISRALWYILFAAALLALSKIKIVRLLVPVLILMQTATIALSHTQYNDSLVSIRQNLLSTPTRDIVTWKEFYDTKLFDEIKKDLNYNGEPVAAVGFHPSILMYNDMNAIDGYISVYPYKDMQKFRKLIAPELEVNEEKCKYFDSWGGRRYLYCSELDYQPTREKGHEPVTLRIDPDVFRSGYKGKYIISRAALKNADELGLTLAGHYTHEKSIYDMWVYSVK